MRERAAYLMDVNHFCGVPPTLLVHCEHPILNYPARGHGRSGAMFGPSMYPKLGSLQEFVHASDIFEDLGASVLSDLEVQKIALLDLRLLNCDRNAANILAVRKDPMTLSPSISGDLLQQEFDLCFEDSGTPPPTTMSGNGEGSDRYQLVPIDHGYSLPSKLLINEIDWAWFYYPQIDHPVHEEIKKYVQTLDIDTIINTLQQQVTLSDDSLFLIRVTHQLVVDGIAAGLTMFDLASMIARTDEDRPSSLERTIGEAEENAYRTIEMREGTIKRALPQAFTFGDDKRLRRQSTNGRSNNNDFNHHSNNSRNSLIDFDTDCSTPSTIANTSPRGREIAAKNLAKFLHGGPSSSIDLTNNFTGTRSSQEGDGCNTDIVDTSTQETIDDDLLGRDDFYEVGGEEVDQFDQHLVNLSHFRAFQGKPLQSIKSLDSVQPLIVSVASLSNASNAAKEGNSTDSESTNGEDEADSFSPSPSTSAFKRLSVTPNRRPSPLQIGSADPSRYQRSNNRKSMESLDTEGGYSANDEGDTSPSSYDDWFSKSSPQSSRSPLKPPTFLRVTSFSAFSSAPMYAEGSERRVAKLQKERRHQVAGTEEFNRLRTTFTKNAVSTLLSKAVKSKKKQSNI